MKKKKAKKSKESLTYTDADIVLLKAVDILQGAKQKDVKVEVISSSEINYLIEEKLSKDLILKNMKKVWHMIKNHLSSQYWEFTDVFSKAASDKLSEHKEKMNHDIMLKAENNLLLSLLYSIFLKYLKLVKKYLKDHLYKEFIVLSDAFYTSSVLFTKKSEEK